MGGIEERSMDYQMRSNGDSHDLNDVGKQPAKDTIVFQDCFFSSPPLSFSLRAACSPLPTTSVSFLLSFHYSHSITLFMAPVRFC